VGRSHRSSGEEVAHAQSLQKGGRDPKRAEEDTRKEGKRKSKQRAAKEKQKKKPAGTHREQNPAQGEKSFTLLDLCVSSLRRGHANLLCIVPILTDDPRRESEEEGRGWGEGACRSQSDLAGRERAWRRGCPQLSSKHRAKQMRDKCASMCQKRPA